MSSDKLGVQARIQRISPLAIYTHCYSHCLNLSIAAACQIPEVRNMIDLINEVNIFLDNSQSVNVFMRRSHSYLSLNLEEASCQVCERQDGWSATRVLTYFWKCMRWSLPFLMQFFLHVIIRNY
jgi:hypothetical protein